MTSPRPRPTPRPPASPVVPPPAAAPPTAAAPPQTPPQTPPPRATYDGPPVTAAPVTAPAQAVYDPPLPPPVPGAEYTETVVAPAQIALGVLVAVVAGVILLALGLWPLAIVAVLLVGAVSAYLSVQTLTVTPTRISVAQGRGDKSPQTIETVDVALSEPVTLTWLQCFGLHLPDTVDSTRFTVRAGPALSLTKRDGEQLRISAADPEAARAVLGR